MLSQVQRRKLTKMFRYLDGDRDDVLVRGDYDRMCGALLGVLEPDPGSPEAAEIAASYAFEWSELEADASRDGGRAVTLELWLAYRARKLAPADAYETEIAPYVETVVALLDRDRDGRLSAAEVRRYLGLYRMREDELDEILGKIDPGRRGSFAREEILALARDYYFSSDESAPGSWLLGRF